jgi:hypothetical protein
MPEDDSTSLVSNLLSSTTDKIVNALGKTPSVVMGVDQEDTTTLLHSTSAPGVTLEPQWERCSGWNSTEFSSSFLEHASGQGISGACAWAAILITCHQVGLNIFSML